MCWTCKMTKAKVIDYYLLIIIVTISQATLKVMPSTQAPGNLLLHAGKQQPDTAINKLVFPYPSPMPLPEPSLNLPTG